MIAEQKIAKEGAEEALKILCSEKLDKEELASRIGGGEDLDRFIERLIQEKRDFVAEKGEHAFKPLMGLVMKEFRGKVDGKVVAEKLRSALNKSLS